MSYKRIVYTRPDGGVAVVTPADSYLFKLIRIHKLTYQEALEVVKNKAVPADAVDVAFINDVDLPNVDGSQLIEEYILDKKTLVVSKQKSTDQIRAFRNQWRWNGTKIVVDPIEEAKERWVRIRAIRNHLLDLSDKDIARASETNKGMGLLKSYRQKLRNIPQVNKDPQYIRWPVKLA